MLLAEVLGADAVPRAGQDLRHRRRRGGARPGAAGHLHRARGRRRSRRSCSSGTSSVNGGRYVFRKDLRRSVIFGRNDLVQDAPISRHRPAGLPQHADVLQRRDAGADPRPLPLRARAAAACCSSARPRCCSATASLFTPVDLQAPDLPQGAAPADSGATGSADPTQPRADRGSSWPGWTQLRNEALRGQPGRPGRGRPPTGSSRWPTGRPRRCSACRPRDIGRPFRDLEVSYRPVELRRYIEQAQVERRTVRITDVECAPARRRDVHLDVQVSPLVDADAAAARRRRSSSTTSPRPGGCRTSSSRPTGSWRRPTRSCSPPTRSWRPPTRSSSPPSRSWRPPTRSSSPPTRSWRR